MANKSLRIYLLVSTQYTNVTDVQTPHDGTSLDCSMARL